MGLSKRTFILFFTLLWPLIGIGEAKSHAFKFDTSYILSRPVLRAFSLNGDCGLSKVNIRYRFYSDYQMACDGIARAKAFFSERFLNTYAPISINFVHSENSHFQTEGYLHSSVNIFGLYDRKTNEVYLKEYHSDGFQKSKNNHFNLDLDNRDDLTDLDKDFITKEIFTSIIAHEVAHLLGQANFKKANTGAGVHEFLAYLVQLDTMDAQVRELILEGYPNETFRQEYMINSANFLKNPEAYGVKSYFWYYSPMGGENFLTRIFNGTFDVDAFFNIGV